MLVVLPQCLQAAAAALVAQGGLGTELKIVGQQGDGSSHSDTPNLPWVPSEAGDVKATVAVLSFILSSAAKHSVDGESLSSELQQLGLPKGRDTGRREDGRRTVVWEPEACHRSGPAPFILPQSMRPACVAVTRRSKACCRSTCVPPACAVSVEHATVGLAPL